MVAVVCPKHGIELEINREQLNLPQGCSYAVTGTCPKCRVKYVNRTLMLACEQFSIDGTTYAFLQPLAKEYPFDPEMERQALEAAREKTKTDRIQVEQEKQTAVSDFKKNETQKEEPAKRPKKKKRKPAKSEKLTAYLALEHKIKTEPNYKYQPSYVAFCDEIPMSCPIDGKKLQKVNIDMKGMNLSSGYCCLYCSHLFLLNSSRNVIEFPQDKQFQVQASETSVHRNLGSSQTPTSVLTLPASLSDIPESTILTAHLFSGTSSIGLMAIVSNTHEQNSSAGIYWIGRVLPSMVLVAATQTPTHQFKYKGHDYSAYIETEFQSSKKYMAIISRFLDSRSPQTVYVFAQKNIGIYDSSEEYEMVTAMVPCSKCSFPVPVTVYYQKSSRMYFINEVTYSDIRRRYGLPYLKLRLASGDEGSGQFGFLRQHSELNLLGYSVGLEGGMDSPSRKKLLSDIIDSGMLSKQEVANHLEWLISTRNGNVNMDNAVEAWTDDLNYVSQYNAEKQRTIWVNSFASKYSWQKV